MCLCSHICSFEMLTLECAVAHSIQLWFYSNKWKAIISFSGRKNIKIINCFPFVITLYLINKMCNKYEFYAVAYCRYDKYRTFLAQRNGFKSNWNCVCENSHRYSKSYQTNYENWWAQFSQMSYSLNAYYSMEMKEE